MLWESLQGLIHILAPLSKAQGTSTLPASMSVWAQQFPDLQHPFPGLQRVPSIPTQRQRAWCLRFLAASGGCTESPAFPRTWTISVPCRTPLDFPWLTFCPVPQTQPLWTVTLDTWSSLPRGSIHSLCFPNGL